MGRIAFVSCGKAKATEPTPAGQFYTGQYFRTIYDSIKPHYDEVYIISAKYGLISDQDILKPYDVTLNKMSDNERKLWARRVLEQYTSIYNGNKANEIDIYAGNNYRKYLLPLFTFAGYNVNNAFKGVKGGMGMQISYIKNKFSE